MGSSLKNRRILITGAASGMGQAIARRFAAEGAALALLDLNGEGVAASSAEVGAQGYRCDVGSRESVDEAVGAAVAGLGGLDGVVNAAGVLITGSFQDLERASWDRMMSVNLGGPYNILQAALPSLQAAPRATIVNIASVSGVLPLVNSTGYAASKAGLLMFTKCLAIDLGPTIRANAICPGVIKTEMTRYIWENEEHSRRAGDRVALKTLGEPEDIAQAALYLSSEASGFVTGTQITVDGGFSYH